MADWQEYNPLYTTAAVRRGVECTQCPENRLLQSCVFRRCSPAVYHLIKCTPFHLFICLRVQTETERIFFRHLCWMDRWICAGLRVDFFLLLFFWFVLGSLFIMGLQWDNGMHICIYANNYCNYTYHLLFDIFMYCFVSHARITKNTKLQAQKHQKKSSLSVIPISGFVIFSIKSNHLNNTGKIPNIRPLP